jgi:hypothetical protein
MREIVMMNIGLQFFTFAMIFLSAIVLVQKISLLKTFTQTMALSYRRRRYGFIRVSARSIIFEILLCIGSMIFIFGYVLFNLYIKG